jgi:hypothetical protein
MPLSPFEVHRRALKIVAANKILRHLSGQHDQKSHGGGGGMNVLAGLKEKKRKYSKKKRNVSLPDETFAVANNELSGTLALTDAYAKYGYNDKPSVSDAEFNELKNAGATVVYRGVKGSPQISANDITVDFREGNQHFVGQGYFGNGTYTTTNFETAKAYSGGEQDRAVMAMAIRPEANFVNYDDLQAEFYEYSQKQGESFYDTDSFAFLDKDPSAVAVHFGYDGITRQDSAGENHYIVLNRSAVVLPQSNEKVG